ncbi:MAG: undecaprenyl-diphosphatase UppP [Bacteroidetes bacterium]|nr:MAG: undecaprenyl-diphosphatase UppP [Bacteroidota bacterium]
MNLFHALILSIVEGITEFLPISSTGHLILTSNLLYIPQTEFVKSFEIIIQMGAICAVLLLYGKFLLQRKGRKLLVNLFLAFIPTAILGFTLYKYIKQYLIGSSFVTVISLFIGGLILVGFEKLFKSDKEKTIETLTPLQSIYIGLGQSVSMIPGVSRAATTIIGGMLCGLSRRQAIEFSFFLAIPTMFAATGFDLVKTQFSFSSSEYIMLIEGFIGAFLTALIAIKFLLNFIQKHTFIPFGIYRIVIALLFWFFVLK